MLHSGSQSSCSKNFISPVNLQLTLSEIARRPRKQLCVRSLPAARIDNFGQHPDLLLVAIESRGLTREQYDYGMKVSLHIREAMTSLLHTQELFVLLPTLRPRFSRLSPHLLVSLAESPETVAARLAELKQLFPSADVYRIINRRPSLLLDSEFLHVRAAAQKLTKIFPGTDVGELVEQQPLLLLEDVDTAIEELKRLLKRQDVLGTLIKDPSLMTAVLSNRLMPGQVDIRSQLLRNPTLLLSVQRGSKSLGPGAEF